MITSLYLNIFILIGLSSTAQGIKYTCDMVQLIRNDELAKSVLYNVTVYVSKSQVKFVSSDRTAVFNITKAVSKGEIIDAKDKMDIWLIKNNTETLYFGTAYNANGIHTLITSSTANTKEELYYRIVKTETY